VDDPIVIDLLARPRMAARLAASGSQPARSLLLTSSPDDLAGPRAR
jgi:hypothetical protein